MTIKKHYYCDACKKKIDNSFPGMTLFWNNAVPYLGRKELHLEHVCWDCTEFINSLMDDVYKTLQKRCEQE